MARAIKKGRSVTPSESYLRMLCERSFLSLWSYPNIFRDQGKRSGGDGKEVCDLLVVFGRDIIIFSDKSCAYPTADDAMVAWSRWRKRSVEASIRQIYGAERWIRTHPDRLYLDRACQNRLPLSIASASNLRVHRIVVALGAGAACRSKLGGSGSLPFFCINALGLHAEWVERPFCLTDLLFDKGFVHVLDDTSLNVLMSELDTVSDFVDYLIEKEKFIASAQLVSHAGEEELLAMYMAGPEDGRPFGFSSHQAPVSLMEGLWSGFKTSERYRQIKIHRRPSYMWDDLIEKFGQSILAGTISNIGTEQESTSAHERRLREMAKLSRHWRAQMSLAFIELMQQAQGALRTDPGRLFFRAVQPEGLDTSYLLLVFPKMGFPSESAYRQARQVALQSYCMIYKMQNQSARNVVGVAVVGPGDTGASEDLMLIEEGDWTENDVAMAREMQAKSGALVMVKKTPLGSIRPSPAFRTGREKNEIKRRRRARRGR